MRSEFDLPFDRSFDRDPTAHQFDDFNLFGGPPRRRKPKKASESLTPDEEKSLISTVKDTGLGSLAYAAGTLDKILGGRAVRTAIGLATGHKNAHALDLLSLIPGSDMLGLTHESQTIDGRDLLDPLIGENKAGFDAGDLAGFAANVLLDPATWLTGGATAITKGAKGLKAAGAFDDIAKVASKKLGREVGPREARMLLKVGEAVPSGSPYRQAFEDWAKVQGHNVADLEQQTVGGLAKFWPTGTVLGTGAKAQQVARKMDDLGRAVRWSKPGMMAAQAFDATVKGRKTKVGQQAAQAATAGREADRAGILGDSAKWVHDLKAAGKVDDIRGDALLRQLEGVDPVEPWAQSIHDAWHGANGQPGIAQGILDQKQALGLPHQSLTDDANIRYLRRELTGQPPSATAGKGRPAFSPFDTADLQREEIFGGLPKGTATMRALADDPVLNKLIDDKALTKDIVDHLRANYSPASAHEIPELYSRQIKKGSNAGGVDHLKRLEPLARFLATTPKSVRESGIFGAHPVASIEASRLAASKSINNLKAVLDALAAPNVMKPKSQLAGSTDVPLSTFFNNLGAKVGNGSQPGVVAELMTRMPGRTARQIRKMQIPKEIADDLSGFLTGFKAPDPLGAIGTGIDSWTSLTKGHLTGSLLNPAFHGRNRVSAIARNLGIGAFSFGTDRAASKILKGGVVKGLGEVPELARRIAARGLAPTDENYTKLFREMLAEHEVVGKYAGEALNRSGGAANAAGVTGHDLLDRLPGATPASFKKIAKKLFALEPGASVNPLKTRGFGDQTVSKFGPMAAGEDLGYHIEGLNRIAPFLKRLKEGVAPGQAAKEVAGAQVEYGGRHFTDIQRQLFRLFPFGKFTSGNTKHVVNELMQKPGGRLGQTIRLSNSGRTDDEIVPDYVRDTASIKIPEGTPLLGPEKGGDPRYLTGLGLMFEDPIGFVGSPKDVGLEALSRMNPLVKGPLEYLSGKSFFQKGPMGPRNMEDMDPLLGRVLANVSGGTDAVKIPGGSMIEPALANSPASRLLSSLRIATDQRKGYIAKAANLLTGLKLTDVSPGSQSAILDDLNRAMMRDLGAKNFTRTYFPKELLEKMTPAQQQEAVSLQLLANMLAKKAKERKAAKEKLELTGAK